MAPASDFGGGSGPGLDKGKALWGLGFRDPGLVSASGCRVGSRVWDLGFRMQGSGFGLRGNKAFGCTGCCSRTVDCRRQKRFYCQLV